MDRTLPFVIHVRRGECRLNYRITLWELISNEVYQMAWRVVMDLIRLQRQFPDRGINIDEEGHREMALKLPERDKPLTGFLSLRTALEGQWQEMDAQQLGESQNGLDASIARARVVILDLIDYRR